MRNSVVIIGSGLMGSSIAAVSALAGNKTVLVDTDLQRAEKGRQMAIKHIQELVENDLVQGAQAKLAEQQLEIDLLDNALPEASFVIEAIAENLKAKQELFQTLDCLLPPEVPICSNTSGLRITEIAALTQHPERTVSTHFWFPGHLVPLVEVVIGDHTDPKVARDVYERMKTWGKAPVLVKKDLPGQLANRIYQAVIREAIHIVAMGLATAEDVDTAIKMGPGLRFSAMGPLEHMDTIGLELTLAVQQTVLPEISGAGTVEPYLAKMVARGDLGCKTGRGFYEWHHVDLEACAGERSRILRGAVKLTKK